MDRLVRHELGTKRLTNVYLCLLEAEGGADCWARPPLPPIDEQRDSISAFHMPFCLGLWLIIP